MALSRAAGAYLDAAQPAPRPRSLPRLERPLERYGATAILVAVLLAALALRAGDLTQPLTDVFSWRETATALAADTLRADGWRALPTATRSGEFPLISGITALLYTLFGREVWLGRAVAVGFGLLAVFALHRLVLPIFGRSRAHASALMLAILPGAMVVDRSFMPDAAAPALATVGLWLLLAWLERGGAWRLIGAATAGGLAAMTSPVGLVALAPAAYVAAAALRREPPDRRRLTPLILALAATAAPALAWTALTAGGPAAPTHTGLWADPLTWKSWFIPAPFLLLAGLGLIARPGSAHPGRWLFHAWVAAAGLVALLTPRSPELMLSLMAVSAPALAALAGAGLMSAAGFRAAALRAPAPARAVFIVAVCLACAAGATADFRGAPARDGRELGLTLQRLAATGERVAAVSPAVGDPVALYYSGRPGWIADETVNVAQLEARGVRWFGVARSARDRRGRLFLAHRHDLVVALDRRGRRVVDDGRMLVWRLPDARLTAR